MALEADEHGLGGSDDDASSGEIGVRPDVDFLESFLDEVHKGRLRVPQFQRPFVWRPDQMLDLFDSIERGFPIGSLLLWRTARELESLDRIGGLRIPDTPESGAATYVLDGHQRLSTLYSCLYRPGEADGQDGNADWIWQIYRVLGQDDTRANRYVHWRKAGPPPPHYLPVRSVLKTLDFLGYARDLSRSYEGARYNELVEEAEQVAQRIKSYKIPSVTLLGGDLSQAVEVFARVNSTGQAMSPDQMVSALTYKGEGEEPLANRIAAILERIAEDGFGQINSTTVFRAVLAVAGEEEVTGARWNVLARKVEGKVSQAAEDTHNAMALSVAFLRESAGVPLARLIPYGTQLTLLTLFFHLCPRPSAEQHEALLRWFWITSWSGQFSTVNATTSKQAIRDMRAFAAEGKKLEDFAGGQGMFDFADQRARPFPERFDLRSARVRAYLLWELREYPVRYTPKGREYPAIDVVRKLDTAAFRRISNKAGLSNGSSPANRTVLEPATPGAATKDYMLYCLTRARDNGILGVTAEALDCLARGDDEAFIRKRAAELAEQERLFIESMGAALPSVTVGEAEIDTE